MTFFRVPVCLSNHNFDITRPHDQGVRGFLGSHGAAPNESERPVRYLLGRLNHPIPRIDLSAGGIPGNEKQCVLLVPVGRQIEDQLTRRPGSDRRRFHGSLVDNPVTGRTFGGSGNWTSFQENRQSASEVKSYRFSSSMPAEIGRQHLSLHHHRRPDFLDRVETRFLFPVRTKQAVRRVIPVGIDHSIPVNPLYTLVEQGPQEAAGAERLAEDQIPVVFKPGAQSAVVESVQELGREQDSCSVEVLAGTTAVRPIVPGVRPIEVFPRMDNLSLLRIVFLKVVVELAVPSAFVPVVPDDRPTGGSRPVSPSPGQVSRRSASRRPAASPASSSST